LSLLLLFPSCILHDPSFKIGLLHGILFTSFKRFRTCQKTNRW
jgi:hypothetical protein